MKRRVALWLLLCSVVASSGLGCAWLCDDDDDDYAYTDTGSTYKATYDEDRYSSMK